VKNLLSFYNQLPFGARNVLKYSYSLIPLRMRLGKKFFKQLEFLEKSQWWSTQELENYQNEELKKLIRHSYDNVPYYYRLFKDNNLTPHDIKTIQDLPKIPILTRHDVRNNLSLLIARNFTDNQVVKLSTSGTTGKPLRFYYDKDKEYLNYDPFVWRYFGWAGHKVGELHATLSCWTTSNELYAYNTVRNFLILSAYNMKKDNAEKYAEIIKKYKVRYLDTYPSAIELLTLCLKDKAIKPSVKLKAIFTHSECLYNWQRKTIEDYWGCKCFDWYGMEERVVLGAECERHTDLHLCSDFAITEFIDDGTTEFKRIVSTSLTNYAMPFIRYDTEDIGAPRAKKCSCQREFPLFTLSGGREKNFAIGKDGSHIPVVNVDIPNVTENVLQFQFIQEAKGEMALNIIKKDTFKNEDLERINAKLKEKFGSNMDVKINFTEAVEQNSNTKTPILVQKMRGVIDYNEAVIPA
jgi:phenylacetate-CoA ligase